MTKQDWSRKLSTPVDLGGRKPLRTIADVRDHLLRLPAEREHWPAVQYVGRLILEAAEGKDVGDISVVLRMNRPAFRVDRTQKKPPPAVRPGAVESPTCGRRS